jgi:Arc/MetJ-type ribon-helix-helix transcriptional regulator
VNGTGGVRDNEFMTIVLKPDQEKAIQEAIHAGLIGSVDEFIDAAIGALPHNGGERSSRADAVRRMEEFGEMHKLDLGERISRKLLHEGHRI